MSAKPMARTCTCALFVLSIAFGPNHAWAQQERAEAEQLASLFMQMTIEAEVLNAFEKNCPTLPAEHPYLEMIAKDRVHMADQQPIFEKLVIAIAPRIAVDTYEKHGGCGDPRLTVKHDEMRKAFLSKYIKWLQKSP